MIRIHSCRQLRIATGILVIGMALTVGCKGAIKDVVRDGVDQIWNKGNVEQIDARYSAAMVAQLREQVESTRAFYPDLSMRIESIAVDGDLFFFRWTVTGTHSKYTKKVELRGVTYGRMLDGKIVDEQIVYDRLDEADQLGFTIRSPAEL